ncbi:MAG: PilZ domain-containing protein [Methylococcales bacterium]
MNTIKVKDKKLNRRVAFRVYEQVNLFYHKIDPSQITEAQSVTANSLNDLSFAQIAQPFTQVPRLSDETALPHSQSSENDTLNVNISSSGIAFTCKEELKPGDYLIIRIFLLSSMAVIMTCCKVVYCAASNPYENNRYPFLIGAHFVNMTTEDSELLDRYINKRKRRKLIINTLLLSLAAITLAVPDVVFGWLLAFLHHVLGVVFHMVYLLYEYAELGLDHVIEHFFHTGRQETQIAVFYILLAVGLAGLSILARIMPRICVRLFNSQLAFWSRKKASFLYFWGEQTLLNKVKIAGIGITAITCYGFFGI